MAEAHFVHSRLNLQATLQAPGPDLDIEDLWHMSGDVDWVKCRKAFQDGELQCPPDAINQIRTITG